MADPNFIPRDPRVRDRIYWYKANYGTIPDVKTVRKFGRVIADQNIKPICFSEQYRMPSTAVSLEVVSSSAQDASGGTGALTYTVQGIGPGWVEQSETVDLGGITPVAIPGTWLREFRDRTTTTNQYQEIGTYSHAGDITVREAGGGQTWSVMDSTAPAKGSSEIGFYTCETGWIAFIESVFVNVDSTRVANVWFFVREAADTIASPFTSFHQVDAIGAFTGFRNITDRIPQGALTGPCDFGFLCQLTQPGTGSVDVEFKITKINTSTLGT